MVSTRLIAVSAAALGLLTLALSGPCFAAQVATFEDVLVEGPVEGDVMVAGGDIRLGPKARVDGHVISIFGQVYQEPGAEVAGRVIAIRSLAMMTLEPSVSSDHKTLSMSLRLASVGGWLLATGILALVIPARLRHGIWAVPRLGLMIIVIGIMAFITLIAAIVAVLGLGPGLGVPLVAALALMFIIGKAFGLTVLGGWLGTWIMRRASRRMLPMSVVVFAGVLVLQLVRFVPLIGGLIWAVVSCAAVGVGVFTIALQPSGEALKLQLRQTGSPSKT